VLPNGRSVAAQGSIGDAARLAHDDTAAFKAGLSSCMRVPAWLSDGRVTNMPRICFKR